MNRGVVAIAVTTGAVGVAGAVASVILVHLSLLVVLTRVAMFMAVGVVIATHHPRHPVAWILLVSGLLSAIQICGDSLGRLGSEHRWPPTLVHALAVSSVWPWFAALFLPLTVGLLRFPDGRLPGRYWRLIEVTSMLSIAVFTVGLGVVSAATPTVGLLADGSPRYDSWRLVVFDVCQAMFVIVALCLVSTIVSLVVRWRRSDGVQREQIRWVVAAGVLAILAQAVALVGNVPGWAQDLVSGLGYALIALAMGIAITRYKLYEINRIVSRTVSYGVVTALLVATYVGLIAGLSALLPTNVNSLVVAAATLAVAALFVPVRRRVQDRVDRRFNRARHDHAVLIEGFAAGLRQGADPADLLTVVHRALEPAHASVWLATR